MQIIRQVTTKSASSFSLPNGWVVEEKAQSNVNYASTIDRTYIEPESGRWFRSLVSVQRYLIEGKAYAAIPKALKPGDLMYLTDGRECADTECADMHMKLKDLVVGRECADTECADMHMKLKDLVVCRRSRRRRSEKTHSSEVETLDPPTKVKWVLSPGRNIWNAFTDDNLVSELRRNKWLETSMSILNNN